MINFDTAKKYGGLFNLRYDDTNPTKEDVEYVDSILEDIQWLIGERPNGGIFYGSDYFPLCFEYAVKLIKEGKAYVCDLSKEDVIEYKGTDRAKASRVSPYRDRSVEENLDLFYRMKNGEFPEGSHTLRAKIDPTSPTHLFERPHYLQNQALPPPPSGRRVVHLPHVRFCASRSGCDRRNYPLSLLPGI